MTRRQICLDTARALRAADVAKYSALLGFDGFVDDIVDVVAQRATSGGGRYEAYDRVETITQFGQRIGESAGHGTNLELVVKRQKLGGNGPIMGHALALLGMGITYAGCLGEGSGIHPVFHDFAARATLISLADAARTHALEFADGKVMMGELAPLSRITFARVMEVIGRERLVALCACADLLGLLNWTMIPAATELWRGFAEQIVPRLARKPRIYVDLADPRKRTEADLAGAMAVLSNLNGLGAPVTLGLNETEARQVSGALQLSGGSPPIDMAVAIRERLKLNTVVVHPTACAVAATAAGAAEFAGPYTAKPAILTGGGDHFNAGFALGQLLALPLEQVLCLATATSGYYVRQGASPTAAELAGFLGALPEAR